MSAGYPELRSRKGKARLLEGNIYNLKPGTIVEATFYYNDPGCDEAVPTPHIAMPDGRKWFQARIGTDIEEFAG